MLIQAHDMSCMVQPEWGGLVRSLRWHAPDGAIIPLLHEEPDLGYRPEGRYPCGLWPMVPFANRAWGGRIRTGDASFTVPQNEPENGAALHGFGTSARWRIAGSQTDCVTIEHRKETGDDPFRYAAALAIRLLPGEAHFTLQVVNMAAIALPFGLGLHPWFPRADDTEVQFGAAGELTFKPGGYRASGSRPWAKGGPFSTGCALSRDTVTAHSVLNWSGLATIRSAMTGLALHVEASDSARHPVLWCPPDSAFVCFEPQSHAIGAPSEDSASQLTPLRVLAPGEAFAITLTIRPERLRR